MSDTARLLTAGDFLDPILRDYPSEREWAGALLPSLFKEKVMQVLELQDHELAETQPEVVEPMNPEDFTDRLDHMVPDQPF
ncbi:hypothetical protein [Piscinibacter sp.]|uniref:hypothetical protein n=1 Tax=Piscinibacter sp. TaxID=1903157 RepID=UPI002B70464D|nr:hypothetical protein [Albitalea sp.]HUG23637.1 hypothetical protein [Albitalea sp.]